VQTIGKYHVVRVLGHGGMGTVYEAVDPHIKRKVALKTMIPELAETAELRARFLREAQAAGGLRHRNIVTVYDLGEDKGRPYIAMEFIEGTDLEKIIQSREPCSMEWKLDVLGQMCEGLAYAHRNGIVHRDIKPANIRVTTEGEVKIMDFGIAHLQSSNLTKSGLVLGTVHYMSPEQIDGKKVDHRADIFSVGAIAYELFSYRKPFDGDSITGVMYKIMHERADVGVLTHSHYSPGLERIIMKALAREVEERYQSLDELHEALAELVRETLPRLAEKIPSAAHAAARVDGDADTVTLEQKILGEAEMRRGRASSLLSEGREALATGQFARAKECAEQALTLVPDDQAARTLALDAGSESLRRRVEQEMSEIRAEMEAARASGHLQRALTLCQRLLDVNPDDGALREVEAGIQSAIHSKEVEQLSSQALAYAADGDVELALKIAGRIERIAPQSPAYLELRRYLEDQGRRQQASKLTAAAQEHLAEGELEEARAAAVKALEVDPEHAVAREIRDRASEVLGRRSSPPARPAPRAEPPAAVEAAPAQPPASPKAPPAESPAAAKPRRERPAAAAGPRPAPTPAVVEAPPVHVPAILDPPAVPAHVPAILDAPPEPPAVIVEPAPVPVAAAASTPAPAARPRPPAATSPARLDAMLSQIVTASKTPVPRPAPANDGGQAVAPAGEGRRSDAEALTTAALEHFVQNDYGKARKAVEKALALEPKNKRARELQKLLGALG
jgi:tetratricopeptide (TPR) repeat protein/tRNA A-37 threonylcarbamoyl transferase component Bud32